ncbi:uncharacterized protein STEHIDRAFT_151312 [Stereum hirsutum FP-91666 SS1]|uniref:uncharacterized protein n=1 Tax=Stereum hirsutum (strain FP-91666) TaxID=721885 RepID=UPI000440E81C|nr:uncharacterized protein STEHIDRAFT_151312 [Stereum hirsutum FP-91666 SS1]EIM91960.1 hypothetical protein STEHIDRAFT_151312 [Stereum hirsutum FP-91666 SS1]
MQPLHFHRDCSCAHAKLCPVPPLTSQAACSSGLSFFNAPPTHSHTTVIYSSNLSTTFELVGGSFSLTRGSNTALPEDLYNSMAQTSRRGRGWGIYGIGYGIGIDNNCTISEIVSAIGADLISSVRNHASGEGVGGDVGGGVGGGVTVAGVVRFPSGSEWVRVVLEMVTRARIPTVGDIHPLRAQRRKTSRGTFMSPSQKYLGRSIALRGRLGFRFRSVHPNPDLAAKAVEVEEREGADGAGGVGGRKRSGRRKGDHASCDGLGRSTAWEQEWAVAGRVGHAGEAVRRDSQVDRKMAFVFPFPQEFEVTMSASADFNHDFVDLHLYAQRCTQYRLALQILHSQPQLHPVLLHCQRHHHHPHPHHHSHLNLRHAHDHLTSLHLRHETTSIRALGDNKAGAVKDEEGSEAGV